MGDAASYLFAAPAIEAMEIHYYHVAQVCDPAISQNLRTLAHQPFWLDLIQPKFFAFVRENQRPNLQKSELRGLARLLRKPRCKFDFYRTSKSVFRHLRQLLEKRRQRKDIVLENGSKAYQASPRTARAVVDDVIVRGVGGSHRIQRSIFFGGIQTESRFAQAGLRILLA